MPTSGKTTVMINSLPAAGAVIIVPSVHVGHVVSQAALELRGPEFDKRCRCVPIEKSEDLRDLDGCNTMIAWDHTFREMSSSELFLEVRDHVWRHNQRFRPHQV